MGTAECHKKPPNNVSKLPSGVSSPTQELVCYQRAVILGAQQCSNRDKNHQKECRYIPNLLLLCNPNVLTKGPSLEVRTSLQTKGMRNKTHGKQHLRILLPKSKCLDSPREKLLQSMQVTEKVYAEL